MSGGSQQLRIFRRAIRDGATLEEACAATGDIIPPEEGRIYLARDAKEPPPPEAYELLGPSKEETMAMAEKKEDGEGAGVSGEYKRPDVAKAFEIYDTEIKPKNAHLSTIKGDLADPHKRIKDDCHFPRGVLNFIVGLESMEDAKRDHHLLALHGALGHRKLTLPEDLVTLAQGKAGDNVVPLGKRARPSLATLPEMGVPSDGSETDLADAAEDPFEASEEELAAQQLRPSVEQIQAELDAAAEEAKPGTGAAARKAMRRRAKAPQQEAAE